MSPGVLHYAGIVPEGLGRWRDRDPVRRDLFQKNHLARYLSPAGIQSAEIDAARESFRIPHAGVLPCRETAVDEPCDLPSEKIPNGD